MGISGANLGEQTRRRAFPTRRDCCTSDRALDLAGPDGERWQFTPDAPPATTIRGSASEFCAVAARRVKPTQTSLVGEGPDADTVLELVRTYAL